MEKQETEVWKVIKSFKDYEISNFGNIKNLKTGKLVKLTKNKKEGYISVSLKNEKLGTVSKTVHSLMASVFLPQIQVNHIDGNKQNNRLDNLEWSNGSLNTLHAYKIGLAKKLGGEKARNVKITEEIVLAIRKDRDEGMGITAVSKKYNLKMGTVSNVYYNNNWKYLINN